MQQLTREEAIAFAEGGGWEHLSHRERAAMFLFQSLLCMPFNVAHEAVEKALGRPVYTHEFGLNFAGIKEEFLGERAAPSLSEILELIPEEKRLVVVVLDTDGAANA